VTAIVRDLAELYGGSIVLADSPTGGLRGGAIPTCSSKILCHLKDDFVGCCEFCFIVGAVMCRRPKSATGKNPARACPTRVVI
jgi:hypothetical protein